MTGYPNIAYPDDPEMQRVHDEYIEAMEEHRRRCHEVWTSTDDSDKRVEKIAALYEEIIEPKRKRYEDLQTMRLMRVKLTPVKTKGE